MRRHTLSLLLIGLLVVLALGSVDTNKTAPSPTPVPPSPAPSPRPPPKPPTVQEQASLDEGIRIARQKVERLLKTSGMDTDISVSDSYSLVDGKVTVQVKIRLVSEDGRRSYQDGSLKRQIYPGLQGVYVDSLRACGFERATVLPYVDSFN